MSPPLLGIEGEGQNSVSLVPSPDPTESGLKEHNYFGLSDCSSVDSSTITSPSEDTKGRLNLKATELRLGLPGSQSPERNAELDLLNAGKLDEKLLFPMVPLKDGISLSSQKNVVSGSKRGFCDTDEEFEEKNYTEGNWMFKTPSAPESETPRSAGNMMLSSKASPNSGLKSLAAKEQLGQQANALQQLPRGRKEMASGQITASNNNPSAPAAKAQVVGWPPIRSFRKNTLATNSKNNDEVDGKPGAGPLFVKVSMDGAPYLRKVDLRLYTTYQELSTALEKMFSCFTLGQCGSHMAPGRQTINESKLRDILHGSEYVLTYEDKDGDWMLVGDVPWEMFIDSCKRLKIMKSTDAIGLAPRAMEKSKLRN